MSPQSGLRHRGSSVASFPSVQRIGTAGSILRRNRLWTGRFFLTRSLAIDCRPHVAVLDPVNRMSSGDIIRGARFQGSFALLLGMAGAYQFFYLPLEAAKRGARVAFSGKVAVAIPLLLTFGAFFAVFGRSGVAWMFSTSNGKKSLTKKGWMIGAVLIAVAFAIAFWFRSTLESLGYDLP